MNSNLYPLLYIQGNPNIITIPDVRESEINTIIRNIKKSASGYDDLPTSIMKSMSEVYIKPLTYLIIKQLAKDTFQKNIN